MSSRIRLRTLLFAGIAVFALLAASCGDDAGDGDASGDLPGSDYEGEITFGDLNWDSAIFHNRIAQYILENGYGYETSSVPGGTVALTQGLINGDVDIALEMTPVQQPAYIEARDAGTVVDHGVMYTPGSLQYWYVPTYVIEGDPERGIEPMAPDLKSVDDLPDYKELFADPEDPSKGRFYDCIAGWQCEQVNAAKFEAYGLNEHYNRFLPGSAAALATSLVAAYERGEPWFGYYWAPTWVIGLFDLTILEEPEYTDECWEQIFAGEEACAYPVAEIHKATTPEFAENAPEVIEFITEMGTTNEQVNAALTYMFESDSTPDDAAMWFLNEYEDVWTTWVPDDVAERVQGSLEGE